MQLILEILLVNKVWSDMKPCKIGCYNHAAGMLCRSNSVSNLWKLFVVLTCVCSMPQGSENFLSTHLLHQQSPFIFCSCYFIYLLIQLNLWLKSKSRSSLWRDVPALQYFLHAHLLWSFYFKPSIVLKPISHWLHLGQMDLEICVIWQPLLHPQPMFYSPLSNFRLNCSFFFHFMTIPDFGCSP